MFDCKWSECGEDISDTKGVLSSSLLAVAHTTEEWLASSGGLDGNFSLLQTGDIVTAGGCIQLVLATRQLNIPTEPAIPCFTIPLALKYKFNIKYIIQIILQNNINRLVQDFLFQALYLYLQVYSLPKMLVV